MKLLLAFASFVLCVSLIGCTEAEDTASTPAAQPQAAAASIPVNGGKTPGDTWYANHATKEERNLLKGTTFRYDAPQTDDWRIDGYLLAMGSKQVDAGKADIVVSESKENIQDGRGMLVITDVSSGKFHAVHRIEDGAAFDKNVKFILQQIASSHPKK